MSATTSIRSHAKPTAGPSSADPHAMRRRGSAQTALEAFVGTWRVTGENAATAPSGGGGAVVGEQCYEWMPGEFFLIGRFRRDDDHGGRHEGTSVLGYEPERGAYFWNAYDNLGYARQYTLAPHGATWVLTGRYERATIELFDDGNRYRERWELSKNGSTWEPLCELEGTRVA